MSIYGYPSDGDVFTESNLAVWNGFGAGVGAGNDTFADLLAGGAAPYNIPTGIIMSTVELLNQTPIATNVSIVVDNATTFEDGFKESDAILLQAAKSISDLINKQGNVNIDFADVESVMSGMGDAVIGAGTARGEERAVLAAQQAICSPLLDSQSISGAQAVLVNITGNKKMTLLEVDAAMKLIHEEAGQGVKVIFGVRVDENMEDELQVTVIATGFNRKPIEQKEMLKERMSHSSDRKSEELMDTPNTTLYQKNNPEGFEFDDCVRDEDNGSDGPTLVFDDFDQSQDLEVPAYIRKQR